MTRLKVKNHQVWQNFPEIVKNSDKVAIFY